MAAPTIVFHINNSATTTPSWQVIGAGDVITFTGSGDVGDPVTAPASGYSVADELWLDAATDYQCLRYEGGGATAAYSASPNWSLTNDDYLAIQATVNPETSAGKLTHWDTSAHSTTAKEILAGTTNMAYNWLRAGETQSNVTHALTSTNSLPAGYATQTDVTSTFQFDGATQLTFTSACSAANENRIIYHCFVPDDAGAGTTGHDPVMTYTYYYT